MAAAPRPSICLTRPDRSGSIFPERAPDAAYLATLYPPALSEFMHAVSSLRERLSGCAGAEFCRRATAGLGVLLDAQVAVVALGTGGGGRCVCAGAMHCRFDAPAAATAAFQYSLLPPARLTARYPAAACPCGLMKDGCTVLVPSGFLPHPATPLDAYMGVPVFRAGAHIGHIAVAWSCDALARSALSWTHRELALHVFAELAAARPPPAPPASPELPSTDSIIPFIAPLASNLSHEIRTPLQGVIGLLDVLYATLYAGNPPPDRDPHDADVVQLIETIQSSGKHLMDLIDNMNEYCGPLELVAKIERSSLSSPLASSPASSNQRKRRRSEDSISPPPKIFLKDKEEEEKVNLCRFVKDVVLDACKSHDAVSRFGPHRGIRDEQRSLQLQLTSSDDKRLLLQAIVEDGVPEYIWVDPDKLQQALIHVIVNAIKFTESGSVMINTRLSSPGEITFSVIDTGIGVPSELKPRLFTPFSQADSSTTRWRDGAGLGLTLARRSIRSLRGDVWLNSSSSGGSDFRIRFPIAPYSPTSSLFTTYPINVMIVEDNPINRQMAYSMLKKLGWLATHVTLCEHGQEAVDKFSGQELVLMDCWMPVLDGFGATKRILEISQERGFCTEVVAITADAMSENLEKTLRIGMAGYVVKPFQIKDLEQVVVRLFGRNQ